MALMMEADCATRFVRFAEQYGKGYTYDRLDELAPKIWTKVFVDALELDYDDAMKALPDLGEKVSYVRYKIAKELGELAYKMKETIEQREKIRKVVLTGGMTKSALFLKFLKEYLVFMNAPIYMLKDETIATKAASYGALITAMVGSGYFPNLKTATKAMCVLKQI